MTERANQSPRRSTTDVDGHRMSYLHAGPPDAPAVLLLHGLVSDSTTWSRAMTALTGHGLQVVAPDLLGHGDSAKPTEGYALDSFAAAGNQLLERLGIERATVVGHSYGGAVAMQLAHSYPGRAERLVLVAAGGLGRQVHPILRVATLPGAQTVVRVLLNRQTASVYRAPRLHRTLRLSADVVANLGRAGRGLSDPSGRAAFFATLDTAIRLSGQRGSMLELDHVGLDLPTLIVWSQDDPVVPVAHAHATHAHLPHSRLEVFPGSTHQPHHHSAQRFADAVADFISTT
ncbi:MAG: alpha/beta hydrolase [bacterium]